MSRESLQLLFNSILTKASTPQRWATSLLVMIPKKESIENQSEFRPITLNDRLGLGFT